MSNRRFWVLAVMVVSVAFAIRVGVAQWWQMRLESAGMQFAMGDSDGYWHLAGDLAAGRPYEYGSPDAAVFRAPGYPWLLSWIVDPQQGEQNVLAGRVLGCLFGSFAVALVIAVVARAFGRTAGLVGGLLAALYPGGITTSVLILSEAPFMPLMMLVLIALSQREACRTALMAGVLSGLAILVRPSWLLFLPFYYAVRIASQPQRLRACGLAVCAAAGAAAVMSPWWIRNFQVTGHFVPTTLQVGASLYDGLNPRATGGSDTGMEFSAEFANQLRAEDAATADVEESFEYRLNQRLAHAALSWAAAHPGRVIALAGRKVYRTWWPWPAADEIPGGAAVRWIFALGDLGILLPGLWFAWHQRRRVGALFPYLLPLVYFTLLHALFVGSVRYRQPALFALIIFAAPQYAAWMRQNLRGTPAITHPTTV